MNATPAAQHPTGGYGSDTDSDDSDVAFAYMDFAGVDFGGGDDDDANAKAKAVSSGDDPLPPPTDDNGDDGAGEPMVDQVEEVKGDVSEEEKDGCSGDANAIETSNDQHVPTTTDTAKNSESAPFFRSSSGQSNRANALSSITFPDLTIDLSEVDKKVLAMEKEELLPRSAETEITEDETGNTGEGEDAVEVKELKNLFSLLKNGQYADILRSGIALKVFGISPSDDDNGSLDEPKMMERIKRNLLDYFSTSEANTKSEIIKCTELEIIGITSLNLFLQLNYTGPSMDRGLKPEEEGGGGETAKHPLDGINPHDMFQKLASKDNDVSQSQTKPNVSVSAPLSSISEDGKDDGLSNTTKNQNEGIHSLKETNTTDAFHNAVLSELAVNGEWPFQVCVAPYFLLLARAVLSTLAEPTRPFRLWTEQTNSLNDRDGGVDAITLGINPDTGANFAARAKFLSGASLWSARAIVAHRRLISTRRDDDDGQACPALWNEAEAMFSCCLASFCEEQVVFGNADRNAHVASEVMLEWGLAQHHFRKLGRGKVSFNKALDLSKLEVEVTGAQGKRTKYQQEATAQYLVRAKHSSQKALDQEESHATSQKKAHIEKQMIKHDDVASDALLLEKIRFEDEEDNVHFNLSILDQSILLALCLDVKNDNPMDGLTGEQMGGYLARVLNQHDDWMVYATALLERAWLECERTHGRERAILQIQALADQHSNRLTLTQSTFKSVEEDSAPAQDRLRNLHGIVYPPRWDMLRDLADRYAKIGIVTSAAEIFEELELWDEVVECYRIAGKESRAEEVVRARLAKKETPRMYAALGDLTNDPKCFERSLDLSNGKFYDAHVALGKFYFDKGEPRRALKHYLEGLEIKPLMPAVWFRVGTLGMQLKEWDTALRAFTEVVQQEPEEGDAWANVAAIHMHRKNPAEAYPALIESLKQNRSNWRVWVSKLYTCIDLKKYDEAIQTCTELLNLKARKKSSDGIPPPEEKCIRAIVGGSLQNYHDGRASGDEVALDSSKRTLARVRQLLDKLKSSVKSEAWLYEISAYFNEEMGWREDVFNDLMKEYRTLQSENGWEEDQVKRSKMINLAKEIFIHHKTEGSKESLVKCKLLVNGVLKKIRGTSSDSEPYAEAAELEVMLSDLKTIMDSVTH
eukprot:CAMPEP_0183721762 /NCGR_PEP_ID=MMETSP0737-20130205/13927_1 /TAXON_ID=385413 /ORGANISM="Thalassiosira miniscula, Strain CCMP1093" /LENGTH=1147 /DNA_ID=CAMNT_0025951815 /DNA_START=39 /DNA_END=3482 /DNA_ORIENTATION=+